MKKFIQDFLILQNSKLNDQHFVLELQAPETLPCIEAGQFAEVLVPGNPDVFLRRPFSIHDVDRRKNIIKLYIKIVGKGTASLASSQPGNSLNIIYPLGKGFTLPSHNQVLVVGGGCGIAPLLLLCHQLADVGHQPDIVLGGRTALDLAICDSFAAYGKVHLITEDGSVGEQGLATQHSLLLALPFSYKTIFACGPTPMLKAVDELAARQGADCQVSLENTMACGIGACLCCVVKTTTGNRCVCTDGPVFDTRELAGWYQPIVKCDL